MSSSEPQDNLATIPAEQPALQRLLGLIEPLLGWSFGQIRPQGGASRFPKQCLRHCLNGSGAAAPTQGCALLKALMNGEPVTPAGSCEKGFEIFVQPGPGGGETGLVFALRDEESDGDQTPARRPERAVEHWHAMLDKLEQIAGELERREEENVRLVDEVLQSYEQLNILFEVTKASITMTRAEEIYDFALARLGDSLRARFACFLDGAGDFSRTTDQFEQREEEYQTYRRLIDGVARKPIGELVRSGEARTMVVSDQTPEDPEAGSRSLLVVPLRSGEEVLGAALFGRPPSDPFRTGDQSMAETVMGQVAHTAHKMRLFEDLHRMSIDVVSALVNTIDAKDNYTCGHSERVAQWSLLLGKALDFGSDELQMLAWAGRLHDVGKIGIRDNVLGKAGKLTPEEFDHIKEHPVISFEVLKPIQRLAPVLDGVRHHHEGWDGGGYPDGLAGEEIPRIARIIQTADVFDALTTTRSYRAAFSVEKALEIMRNDAGSRLDPDMVELFITVLEQVRRERPDLFAHMTPDQEASGSDARGDSK